MDIQPVYTISALCSSSDALVAELKVKGIWRGIQRERSLKIQIAALRNLN